MLNREEMRRFQKVLEILSEEDPGRLDVSNRLRDDEGKFLPNPSESEEEVYPTRSIRLVKVKGTYGTYDVKDWDMIGRVVGLFVMFGVIIILMAIF